MRPPPPSVPDGLPTLPPLDRNAHKGSRGRVLVIAGSTGLGGAAFLAAQAALRAGAGVVTLAIPRSLNPTLEAKTTEIMTVPMPETTAGSLSPRGLDALVALARGFDAVSLGPGLGQHRATQHLVRRLVAGGLDAGPMVIDADGLNALAGVCPQVLGALEVDAVLTPHPGEMARLAGLASGRDVQANRESVACSFAAAWERVVLLLKGPGTLVTRGSDTWRNPCGGPALATAGSGDVLTGVVSAFLAQGLSAEPAARLGAWIHGRAGDLAAATVGEPYVSASAILDHVPAALKAHPRSGS